MLLVGIFILAIKYSEIDKTNIRTKIKKISVFSILLVSLLLVFSITFVVSYSKSSYNLPRISNISSEYKGLVDVGDGIVVVGRTRLAIRDLAQPSSSYENSRAYIVKYSYGGDLIWDDVYYVEDEVYKSSTFRSVHINSEGNIVATGTFGGHSDGYSLWEVVYNLKGEVINFSENEYDVHSMLPFVLTDTNVLSFQYKTIDYDLKLFELDVLLSSSDNEDVVKHTIQYQHDIISEYNTWEPRVDVVYSDEDDIVVGVTVYDLRDTLVFSSLFVFDTSLNFVKEVNLPDEIVAGKIHMYKNKLYMLSRNDVYRKSHIVLLDTDFIVTQTQSLQTNLDYYLANDIVIQDDLIYIGGNEYKTKTKEGFVEYFSGIIHVYSMNLSFEERKIMKTGVAINQMVIVENQIYTAGIFNTSLGLSKSSINYAWCGVFSVVDADDRNYVLAFTHRKER
jgi:hypothetical protein